MRRSIQLLTTALLVALSFVFVQSEVYAKETKVDMTKCITLTVKQGVEIKMAFAASTVGVWVKVTGVKGEGEGPAPTELSSDLREFETTGTEVKVYGTIDKFACCANEKNLTALDVSKNTELTALYCYSNQLRTLDVSQNTQLTRLDCSSNQLRTLDVSKNTRLTRLICGGNQLSTLDVSKNTQLTRLECLKNQLRTLDISKNTQLTALYCYSNQLRTLDVSKNTQLRYLDCNANSLSMLDVSKNTELEKLWLYGNLFSTSALNAIYCQIPDRRLKTEKGKIFPVNRKGDATDEVATKSSRVRIAKAKNWVIQYWSGRADIEGIE